MRCDVCKREGAMHVAVGGHDTNLCKGCCKYISEGGTRVTTMEPIGRDLTREKVVFS